MTQEPMLGAVAYDQKVVPIWEGIREYFRGAPVEMDVVLFLNYEAQVNALLSGKIDIAWNTNLAYVRTFHATHGACRVLAMRDTDVAFFTLLVGRAGAFSGVEDVRGRTLALGSADSAQAAIMPVHYLTQQGLRPGDDVTLLRFDSDVGKHGDTGRSEREALAAVLDGRADVAAVGAASWDVFVRTGEVPPGSSRRSGRRRRTRTATSRRCRRWTRSRGRMGRAPPRDGLGRPGAPAHPRTGGAARMAGAEPRRLRGRVRRGGGTGDRGPMVNERDVSDEPVARYDGGASIWPAG